MDQDDGRWLTYPELAAVRGIDKPSAIRLATRKKWRRQRDNRRVVRVLVPPEWLSRRYQSMDPPMEQPDRDMDLSSDRTDFAAALAAVEAAHAGEIAALHGQIAGLKDRAERAEVRSPTARPMSASCAPMPPRCRSSWPSVRPRSIGPRPRPGQRRGAPRRSARPMPPGRQGGCWRGSGRRGWGGSRQPLPAGPAYAYDRFKLL